MGGDISKSRNRWNVCRYRNIVRIKSIYISLSEQFIITSTKPFLLYRIRIIWMIDCVNWDYYSKQSSWPAHVASARACHALPWERAKHLQMSWDASSGTSAISIFDFAPVFWNPQESNQCTCCIYPCWHIFLESVLWTGTRYIKYIWTRYIKYIWIAFELVLLVRKRRRHNEEFQQWWRWCGRKVGGSRK